MKLLKLFESAPSPHRMDGTFNVANVAFDNERGLGNTPNGQNVVYMGATAWMKPSVFRKLARQGSDVNERAEKIEELVRQERAIAAPFLILTIHGEDPSNPEKVNVHSHEGRARSIAFEAVNGDIPMPVQLFPRYLRARDLKKEFFEFIEAHGIYAEDSDTMIVKPSCHMYYCGSEQYNF